MPRCPSCRSPTNQSSMPSQSSTVEILHPRRGRLSEAGIMSRDGLVHGSTTALHCLPYSLDYRRISWACPWLWATAGVMNFPLVVSGSTRSTPSA